MVGFGAQVHRMLGFGVEGHKQLVFGVEGHRMLGFGVEGLRLHFTAISGKSEIVSRGDILPSDVSVCGPVVAEAVCYGSCTARNNCRLRQG